MGCCLKSFLPAAAHCVLPSDITTGLNGQTLTIGLGTPDNLVLRGSAFPVIVAQDGVGVMAAAARVSDAGGKVVAFNKVWTLLAGWLPMSVAQPK